jgi:outer membrane immunogenic protein
MTSFWRRSLLALTVSLGMAAGATVASADGLDKGRGGDWPNIPWTWTGIYGGIHLGTAETWHDDGFIGGVQFGRNWRNGKVIYGLEGDVSFSNADGVDWFGTVRGRLGYLISPGILFYGTAGLGLVDFEKGGTDTEFVYGLGVEGRITQATTLRLEYIGFSDSEIDVVRVGLNFKFNW